MLELVSGIEFHGLRRYENRDLEQLNRWYDLRHCPKVDNSLLPGVGFIADEMAAGFLYQTDSSLCLLDGYVSNPLTYKEDRDKALNCITQALLTEAKRLGFKKILAFTTVEAIATRAMINGFHLEGPQILLTQENP